jgi:hypothetical protein
MTFNARRFNSKLGKTFPGLVLRGGRGYQYFTLSRPGVFETRSVYVYRMSDFSEAEWLVEAREFMASLGLKS